MSSFFLAPPLRVKLHFSFLVLEPHFAATIFTNNMFLQELSSREDELRQIKMAQEVHAESLKKREEELAQREMLLLGREISMLIQVQLSHTYP